MNTKITPPPFLLAVTFDPKIYTLVPRELKEDLARHPENIPSHCFNAYQTALTFTKSNASLPGIKIFNDRRTSIRAALPAPATDTAAKRGT